ncbi:uncharacterized protein LOC142980182, partial [Anticarsia gemmatalis]|uniref:uncharacterized protein LOC142980182 n=1 Tax=Anticarsia gemmatalis TaxID=129554 RepID=UPI003F77079F
NHLENYDKCRFYVYLYKVQFIFQSHINHVFTTLTRYGTIRTLSALYESDKTLYVSPSIRELLRPITNPEIKAQESYMNKTQMIPESYSLGFALDHPRTALVGRKQDILIEILGQYVDEYGKPLINIIDECFYTFYLSYIARPGFPFYEELQRFMQRIGEAGLPHIYYRWTCDMLGVPSSLPKVRSEPRPFAKVKLENQCVAFGMLVLGYFVSLIVFALEIWRGKRDPNIVVVE